MRKLLSRLRNKLRDSAKHESYAQLGEDLIVKFIFDHFKIHQPGYLDIGAYDPSRLNNTYLLYKSGATGINIEPNIKQFRKFTRIRPKDIDLNIGISDKPGLMNYYEMDIDVLNTFSELDAHQSVLQGHTIKNIFPIKTDSIANVLQEHTNGRFPEFLNLDCEGMEVPILSTIDFQKNYPLIICLETVEYSQKLGRGKKRDNLIASLETNGFIVFADTYINTIFVNKNLI
jgi:FkbM family methyltransferase